MTSQTTGLLHRKIALPMGFIAMVAIIVAYTMYKRAGRAEHRSLVAAQAMAAWAEDMSQDKKDLPRFLPLAKENMALQRTALAGDQAAYGGTLFTYALMTEFSHMSFMGKPEVPPAVHQFELDVINELGDVVLALLAVQDVRALAYSEVFTDSDVCVGEKADKCERALLESAKLATAQIQYGKKEFENVASKLARELNSRAWDVVSAPDKPGAAYARALAEAQTAAAADPKDADNAHTLALAEFRSRRLDEAAKAAAKAIALRENHVAETTDLAIKALIDAKAGRMDEARAALKTIDERRAKIVAEAVAKGHKPEPFDETVTGLVAEARALLK